MKYRYTARTKQGELQTGFVEGDNRDAAFNILASHELYVLNLEQVETRKFLQGITALFQRVSASDLMVFTRQFATLLEAKISLGDALKNLYKQTRNPILKETIYEVSADIDAGLSLSQAMKKHQNIFSEFYVSMVRSAEVTGRLEEVIGFMADYLEKEAGLLSRVRNALIYPILLIVLFLGVVVFMVTTVFPQLLPIFEESGAEIPLLTRVLFGTGTFFTDWWLAILIALGVIVFVFVDYFGSEEGKVVLDELRIRMPGIGGLYRRLYISRFAESTAVLVRGGIPVAQALEISGHTIGSIVYRDVLHSISESVRGGQLMSQALAEHEYYFPPLVSQMVAVGESTGKLDALLSRVSVFYAREVDDAVAGLVELIQPALIVGIGALVALLFAAVLLPIFNLSKAF